MHALFLLSLISIVYSNSRQFIYTQVTYISHLENESNNIELSNCRKMLKTDENLIIFASNQLQFSIRQIRKEYNTVFIAKDKEQFIKSWYFPYFQILNQKNKSNSTTNAPNSSNTDNLVMLTKIYLMTQALKYDKFNSDFFVWVDANQLYSNETQIPPEQLLKYLFQMIQPQWMLFTKYYPEDLKLHQSHGEQRFIQRRFRNYELVVPTFMGGYVQIIKDIKNAVENLMRIMLQRRSIKSEEAAVSLLPILYPALIPNTVSIKISDIVDKIHIYEDVNRVSSRSRQFKSVFQNGKIILQKNKTTTKCQIKSKNVSSNFPLLQQESPSSHFQKIRSKANQKQALSIRARQLVYNTRHFQKHAIYIQLFILIIFFFFYIALAIKNINSTKLLEKDLNYLNYQPIASAPE